MPHQSAAHAAALYLNAARSIRDFADGFVTILEPIYLTAIGYGAAEIGLVATVALLGSVLMTFSVGSTGSRISPRGPAILAVFKERCWRLLVNISGHKLRLDWPEGLAEGAALTFSRNCSPLLGTGVRRRDSDGWDCTSVTGLIQTLDGSRIA